MALIPNGCLSKVYMKLLNYLLETYKIKNDRALAHVLSVSTATLSKIRHGAAISSDVILKIHEGFNMPVKKIRDLI